MYDLSLITLSLITYHFEIYNIPDTGATLHVHVSLNVNVNVNVVVISLMSFVIVNTCMNVCIFE